jgi:hypothetical protein
MIVLKWTPLTLLRKRLGRLDEGVLLKQSNDGPWVDGTNTSLQLVEEFEFVAIPEFYQLAANTIVTW